MNAVLLLLSLVAAAPETSTAPAADEKPVRIGTPVGGHIHPALCISKKGTLVVTFGQVNHTDLRITRSSDGGRTWTAPEKFAPSVGKTFYPGSLTALRDGRIVHCWNRWDTDTTQKEPRSVLYSTSADEGATWSEPAPLPFDGKTPSIIRHPLVELPDGRWLAAVSDKTIAFDAKTGAAEAFGGEHPKGLMPLVRTPRGTYVSGAGLRSTDEGKTWTKITGMPDVFTQWWRHELTSLPDGTLLASEIPGPGVGGVSVGYRISRDDGVTWTAKYVFHDPGRPVGGRACPRTVQIDERTIGVVYYDVDPKQEGGPAVWFLRIPLAKIAGAKSGSDQ